MALSLTTLPDGYRALVAGATGGIGAALCEVLAADPRCSSLSAASRTGRPVVGANALTLDLTDEDSVAAAVEAACADGPLHLVIAATGLLHDEIQSPEKSWRQLDAAALMRAWQINAVGPALLAKHALPALARGDKSVFAALSARVGSISDNRLGGWHAYRASKAGLNQIVKTLSVELARKSDRAIIVALHPGTVDTGLSAPFQANVPEGRLFSPARAASSLLRVVDDLTPSQSGRIFDWAGKEIAP